MQAPFWWASVYPALQVSASRPLGSRNVLESEQLEKMSSYWASFLWEKGVRITSVIFGSVQLLSRVRLFVTPRTRACQASLSIINFRSLPKLIPLSWWCHPIISSSVIPFSFCLQSFPASGSFQISQLFASDGHTIALAQIILHNLHFCLSKTKLAWKKIMEISTIMHCSGINFRKYPKYNCLKIKTREGFKSNYYYVLKNFYHSPRLF